MASILQLKVAKRRLFEKVSLGRCCAVKWCEIYEIHIVLRLQMKVESDHHSKFSNLRNWKEEAWKISGLQRDSNPYNMNFIYISRNGFIWITNVIHKSFTSTQVLGIQEDWIKSKLIKSKCWCSLSPRWTSQRSSTPTSTLYQVSLLVYHYQENPKDRKNWKLSIFYLNLKHILFPTPTQGNPRTSKSKYMIVCWNYKLRGKRWGKDGNVTGLRSIYNIRKNVEDRSWTSDNANHIPTS